MKTSGWILLVISWCGIIGVCIYCFSTIFRTRNAHIVTPIEIEAELEKLPSHPPADES